MSRLDDSRAHLEVQHESSKAGSGSNDISDESWQIPGCGSALALLVPNPDCRASFAARMESSLELSSAFHPFHIDSVANLLHAFHEIAAGTSSWQSPELPGKCISHGLYLLLESLAEHVVQVP